MLAVDIRGGGREKIPPLAFRTARALKVCPLKEQTCSSSIRSFRNQELVLRVDRIESGELTVEQNLNTEL